MANVRVALRVRPLSKRETEDGGRIIVEVDGKVAKIRNIKMNNRPDGFGDSREKVVTFGFDYCYWSVNPEEPQYASQDVVFQDLGTEVLSGAAKGYNMCLFAYGQTGSGKTYTMLGTPVALGLTPRICEGLFIREKDYPSLPSSCGIKISFLEIYNERVRDLLMQPDQKKSHTLRVREHPEMGPYVQGLSQHVVTNYKQVIQLLEEGIANRVTAATHVHETSSRSHAIFTICYTQAVLENNLPSEIASKISLVDLAGSERADPSYCKDRITEGANINKSLVTLGIVISTLAQNSQVFSCCQSLISAASDGDDGGTPSSSSGTSSGGRTSRWQSYIPYRDSVLTWLLKDCLGGNSKTIMVATVSPAHTSYNETMSTLRYASNAKSIINKPQVNEDANVKLIRELREEIERLKAMLLSFELRNFSSLHDEKSGNLKELVLQNELKIDQLAKDWTQKWNDWKAFMEHYGVDINRGKAGLVIHSSLPHLMALEDDVLSTGVVLYHLKEGTTKIGRVDSDQEQDIVLQGQWIERDHCTITSACGVVVLRPTRGAHCTVNGREVTASCRLTQGAIITLGKTQKFRFNHPAEAAALRRSRQVGEAVVGGASLEWLDLDGDVTACRMGLHPLLWKESVLLNQDHSTTLPPAPGPTHQISEKTPSEEHLPQTASYSPRTRSLNKNDFCFSGQGQLHTVRKALALKGVSLPGSCLTVSPRFASIQEMERVDRHPRQKVSQGSASLSQQANKLKPRDEPEVLTPASQSRRYKGLAESGSMQARWQQEGNLPTHKATRGASCGSSHPSAPKQTSGCKKADMTLQAKSERQQRVLADGVRGTAKKLFHLPHGIPVKREYSAADPDTVAPLADSSPVVGHAGEEDDLSDTNSDYSEDSLSSVYAKAPAELMKPEGPLGKKLDLPTPEHSERDDSHVSEDSLGERRYQTPSNSPEGTHLTSGPGSHKARMRACGKRACIVPSDSGLLAQARKSFSLDSLLDGEEELGEEQQEELVLDSAQEGPTETFWHLQSSGVRAVDQETTNTSFYLDPPFQPHCEQPGSAVGACCHEKASSLPGMLPSRDSPHQESMDSWFSCDSKFNPSDPPGTVGSLSPNPLVQEFQLCGWEKPGYWLNTEELKPSRIAVLPGSYTLLQGGAVLRCNTRDRHITPASDASKLSLWATHRFLQQGAGGTSQGRAVPDTAQQGTSEASNSSSVSNVLAASATSLPHLGTACDWDWSTVQQKYLLELSHPVLEATGEPRPDFPYFEEDSASLIQASDRGRDGLLPVGPGVSSNQDFNNFSLHLAKSSHLRAEKEQESLSTKLEGPSHFFRTSEKEVHYNETSPADLESLPSGTTSAQVLAAEGKIADLMTEMCEVKQDNLEEYSQGSRKTGLMTSSEECFFLKNSCHGNGAVATKDHWLQGCMPLRKNIRGQPGQLRHSRHRLLQEKKADCQQSSRDTDFSFAFLSESELCLHPAPRGLLPSSLQPPPLETFYVTKSRDALTETALEIPACRKAGVCSVPRREAWPSSLDHHTLQNAYLENNLPALLQNQSSKLTSSQQITADSPVAPNSREVIELRQCPGNSEESYHSIYFSLAQNTSLFSFANTKIREFENQVGIINKKHGLLALEDREKALTSSCCSVSSSSSVSGKPVFVCESGEGAQGKNAVLRQSHVLNKDRQIPSETKSDFFCKAISLGLRKNILGETPISLKSRAVDHNASSPVMAQDESPDHKWEGKNERGLLGKAVHSQDSSDKLKLLGVDSTGETFWTIPSSQERNLSGCKQPRKLPERTKEEPSVKKQKTRVSSDEEMAKLIRSVMQLEHSVLEIESKQSKKLHGSYTQGVREEMVFQDQKADHVLKPGSPGDHLSFKDQPHSPKYHDGVNLKDSQVGEMKALGNCIGKDPQVQSPFKTREFVEEIQLVREHTRSAPLERSVGNTWDYLRTCTAFSVPADPSLHPGRMTALDKTLSLQTSHERSSKTQGKLLNVPASHQGQSYDLGSLAELETLKVFQKSQVGEHTSSLNQEDLKVQDGIEEMTLQMGQSLQEENRPVTSHRECPGPSQLCMSRFFSQETVCPLLSQTDSPIASSHQDLTNTLPFSSLRVPGSYFHPPDTVGIFSVDYVLNPTVFKTHDSPLVARVRDRDQSGYTRSHSPQGYVRGVASMAQSTWCGSAISVTIGAHGQSDTPESLSLEEEGRISASTTTQDQAGGIRSTFIHLSTRDDFGPEMETAIQKDRKRRASPLNRNSSQLEQKTSSPLEEGGFQDREARQKAANGAEDLSLTSDAISAPASLTGVPNPQPRTWESSAHASLCLALLEEIRQAKAQGRQLNDFLARRTVLPHSESLLEPRCSSWFPMRPQCKQMDQSVSGGTRNEGEAQGFHGAFLSAEPGQLLTDAGRASPKQGTLRPGALRRVELGDPSQCVNWKGVVGSRLAEAYRPGSKHPVPSSLPDQTTSQNPRSVQMEAPFRRSEEIVDCDVSGSTEHSRSLSQSRGQEESQTPPSLQLSYSPCVTSQAYSLHSSTSLCCGSGSLEKGAAKPTPDSIHSPSIVPSRLGGLDERGAGHSREPDVLLAHGLKPRCRNRKFGSADCSTLEPLLTATVFSLAQGCSSSLAHERRASSLGHSSADGSTTSAESPERKFVEKKASTEFEAVPPVGTCCEPLMKLQDSCAANQATQASRTQSEPPAANGGLNAPQNLSEMSIKNELVVESYHRYGLEKTFGSLPEKPQLSAESGDHSSMDSQAEFVARLKQQGTQVDSLWEEEEQQRDQPLGGGGNPVQGGSPALLDEDDLDSQIKNARTKEEAVSKPGKFSPDIEYSATWHLRQSGPQPPGERPGQPRCGRKHPGSVPVIAVFSGPKDCLGPCPRPQFSVVSSTRSIQELNLSVEPPFPTDKDTQEPSRLWSPHPTDCCSKELEARTPKVEDHSQKASSDLDNRTGDHKPSKPAPLASPVSSALLCQPTTDFLTSWMFGTLEQTCKGRPEKPGGQARPVEQLSEVDKRMIHIDSSRINPYILPQRPEGLRHVGWKQYVFDSAVNVSCSQTPQGLAPSSVAQGSSMDRGLEDQKPPFHPHLGACASAWDLSSICSSTENAQHSDDALEVCGYSFPVGQHHNTAGPEGADKRFQIKIPPGEAGLRYQSPLTEGSATGPVDEIMLLCPTAAGRSVEQARMGTLEQGTQTLGCRLHWSCTDISATPEASTMPFSQLASWTSMHSLSLHLSQLLHSTSELLGSLSQPSVAEKEQNFRKDSPGKAPQALRMDSFTQTTVDEGSQTDLASSPLPLQAPEANPQVASESHAVLGSDTLTECQEKGGVPRALDKREVEETAGSSDFQEESIRCRLQRPIVPSSHSKFEKDPLGQQLLSVGPQDSPSASLPPSSQPETSACLTVSSPSLSISHSLGPVPNTAEATGEPTIQEKKLGRTSALLVDRASSPILTLSASAQGSCLLSDPSSQLLEGHQKPDSSPALSPDPAASPDDVCSQPGEESGDSRGVETQCEGGRGPLERSDEAPLLVSLSGGPQHCSECQGGVVGQPSQQCQPRTSQAVSTWVQKNTQSPPLVRSRSQRLAKDFVHEKMTSPECSPLSSRGPAWWQSRTDSRGENPVLLVEPQPASGTSPWGDIRHLSSCPVSGVTDSTELRHSTWGPAGACQPEGLLSHTPQTCVAPEPLHHSLWELPIHNKFSNWGGVQDYSPLGLGVTKELGTRCDHGSGKQGERPFHALEDQSQAPEWPQREEIRLKVGAPNLPLSLELTEAKLHRGFGEADALLRVLQSGTGEALAAGHPTLATWEELRAWQNKAIQTVWRERAEHLQNFRRTRSLSPRKQVSLLPNVDFPIRELSFPSRRRDYLQQLRKDVVETTRSSEAVPRSSYPPSDIELMLRDYQQAWEEAKVEIARARDRLREQTQQEKLRIHQRIISQLLREEKKLHTLANSSSLCTSSNGSLSSGVTSGYNSNSALSGQLWSPDSLGDTDWSDSRDAWMGNGQGRPAVKSRCPCLTGPTWKSSVYGRGASMGSCCCSPSSLFSSRTCFSSSYQDLARHIVDISVADVMAACSDNLHNLFIGRAAADWNYQGEEQKVQLYYKVFSSTRHGFLGAGVVSQSLPQVWAAVSDPTLWPLYHKPIQTARLHQRVTNSISLVYLLCGTTLCALKPPRDFCCVCVEAKEGHLSIMAAQSVYDTSMPRPRREVVRGEILPSAWILQPLTVEGKEVTRVICLAQVELGAPGFAPQLLNTFIKQQPLVIARLASFLGS